MAAHARRQKTGPNYSPYIHENTHVFLPDGSHHEVQKTSRERTSKEVETELKALLTPWEKDSILSQAESQNSPQWALHMNEKPLDKGGLRQRRSNVAPSAVKNWDTFELSFDRADVATPDRQQAVFDEVVAWAKEIHTEGLEGGLRAFTIQDWHGLDGTSSRPHLRLEIHRIGWEPQPAPQLINGKILKGKVQQKMNYSQESGETDKDFQVLGEALREKFGIELSVGAPSLERPSHMAVPKDPAQAIERSNTLLEAVQNATPEDIDALFALPPSAETAPSVEPQAGENTKKPFELRKPTVNPFEAQAAAARQEAQAAIQKAQLLEAAYNSFSANATLTTQNQQQAAQIQDLTIAVDRTGAENVTLKAELSTAQETVGALTEKTQELETLGNVQAVKIEELGAQKETLQQQFDQATEKLDLTLDVNKELEESNAKLETQVTAAQKEAVQSKAVAELAKEQLASQQQANQELQATNSDLRAELSTTKQSLETTNADLRLVREELAPTLKENADLRAELSNKREENLQLAENLQKESTRRSQLLGYVELDNMVLAEKINAQNELFSKIQKVLGHNQEGLEALGQLANLIKPKENYVSRVEAFVEHGLAVKGDKGFESFQQKLAEIDTADGSFAQNARRQFVEAKNAEQTLSQQTHKAIKAEKQAMADRQANRPKGPMPNPAVTGGQKPVVPSNDPKDPTPSR